MDAQIKHETNILLDFIKQHPKPLILTGAGISLASGIPTYRDQKGTWKGNPPMQHQDFIRDETTRQRYWARSFIGRTTIADAQPNAAHYALAELEALGYSQLLITQNVDNLHQRAGSQRVADLHGNLKDIICLQCGANSSRDDMQTRLAEYNPQLAGLTAVMRPDGDAVLAEANVQNVQIPSCTECSGVLMPDVVFFGGVLPKDRAAYCLEQLQQADALLVIGSSLQVFSGYRFCLRAKEWGKPIALNNPGTTRADKLASLHLRSPCTTLLPAVLDGLTTDKQKLAYNPPL